MTGRMQDDASAPFSLPAVAADRSPGTPLVAASSSTQETDMYLVSEQMARSHIQIRHQEAEAWRIRRIALAVRRAETAERRARLARAAAVLAVRESAVLAVR